jgi:HlyD family secretion protein
MFVKKPLCNNGPQSNSITPNPLHVNRSLALVSKLYHSNSRIFSTSIACLIAVCACLSLIACNSTNSSANGPIVLSGTVEAREIDLSFQVNGRIATLNTDEGQWLEQGATAAQLDTRDFQLAVQQAAATADAAKANLDALVAGPRAQEIRVAEADLQKAQSQLNYAQAEVKRFSSLIPKKLASEEQLEQAQLQYEVAVAGVEQAKQHLNLLREGARKEDIQRAQAEFNARNEASELAKQQLNYTQLPSPVSGLVTVRLSEAGEVVGAGQPVVRVAELSKPWVRAYLSGPDLGRVRVGQKAQVTIDGFPDKVFEGTLTFISPVAEFTPKTVETRELRVDLVYRVKVEVKNPQGMLKIGMPADISLQPVNTHD